MNWENTHEYTAPEHPWKDESTREAYESLKATYWAAVDEVAFNDSLTASEKESRLMGIETFADLAFVRYGGVPVVR